LLPFKSLSELVSAVVLFLNLLLRLMVFDALTASLNAYGKR
jgi:hypothetical protein